MEARWGPGHGQNIQCLEDHAKEFGLLYAEISSTQLACTPAVSD